MPPFSSILPFLLAAFGLGALLGWALKSLLANKRIRKLEETWAARLQNKENELELTISKLGSFLNALQTNYSASQATIREHEASLAKSQVKLGNLEARLAARTAELDRDNEALSREAQDWEAKYHAVAQAKDEEIGRLQSRVRELERLRKQSKHWMFSVLLQERETTTAKLTPLHLRP